MRYLLDTNVCVMYLNGRSTSARDHPISIPTEYMTVCRTPIGAYDLQIVAIALVNNLMLVTHNVREFERVEGLQVEDWEVEV